MSLKACPHAGISSTELPSAQMTPVCIELTQTNQCTVKQLKQKVWKSLSVQEISAQAKAPLVTETMAVVTFGSRVGHPSTRKTFTVVVLHSKPLSYGTGSWLHILLCNSMITERTVRTAFVSKCLYRNANASEKGLLEPIPSPVEAGRIKSYSIDREEIPRQPRTQRTHSSSPGLS